MCFTYQFLHNNSMGLSSSSFLKLRNLHSMKFTRFTLPWCLNLKVHVPEMCVSLQTQNYCPCHHSIQTQHKLQLHSGGEKETEVKDRKTFLKIILKRHSPGDCLSKSSDIPCASFLLGNELYRRLALCYTCKAARLLFVLGSMIRDYVTHHLLHCTS